ncbi:Acylphosphatase [Acidilobus saccharovorans 345-15]|uniref:Acylphosphatase n=1 Tax=Acidilobus saccharovorans (strain DSM 16705 / JCM 18335 / VKM B-2471 / 345-15) TaxID=666510 RepID=D9Q1K9_ACIS3|nr:Acylphosphatase [Acidilobus saccharovorans 345-15]
MRPYSLSWVREVPEACKRIRVTGVVQGVGFRAYVRRHATMLGLTGYAKNMPDGSVEIVAQGQEKSIEELLQQLRESHFDIDNIEVEDLTGCNYAHFTTM